MDYVHLHEISRRFGDFTALQDVSVSLRKGELISFVGPSGAGKTTLLRLLAGLDEPSSGSIERERAITRDHPAILVFQDYLLFPHMSVFENVAFGLRSRRRERRRSRAEIRQLVMHYLEQLGIADKARSWPGQLSGGQKQRVALARALVMEPGLLLLDEPFANLDKNLKRETARFIRRLQKDLEVTTVVVSHDLEEASEVSDRIGVIINARLHQIDTFDQVYFRPANLAVAELFGPVNQIPRRVFEQAADELGSGRVGPLVPHPGPRQFVCSRAESLEVVPDPRGTGMITDLHLLGGSPHYTVTFDGWDAEVRVSGNGHRIGTAVSLHIHNGFIVDGQAPLQEVV